MNATLSFIILAADDFSFVRLAVTGIKLRVLYDKYLANRANQTLVTPLDNPLQKHWSFVGDPTYCGA